jgi:hypothetical protein
LHVGNLNKRFIFVATYLSAGRTALNSLFATV